MMQISNLPTHVFFIIRDFVFLPDSYQNHRQSDGERYMTSTMFGLGIGGTL